MVDLAALASFVVLMCDVPDWRKESTLARRRQFIVELGEQLVKPLISRRLEMPTVIFVRTSEMPWPQLVKN